MIRLKNAQQIEGIKKSCQMLAQVFEELEKRVKPGVTPLYLNKFAEETIAKRGGEAAFSKYGGFPTALCASINDAVIHGLPTDKPLQEGDIIGLDLGIALNGYFSDMAKTFAVGPISQQAQALLADTEASLYKGIAAAAVGGRIQDIGKAVSGYLKPKGYGVVYEYCGHGVGLAVHEDPPISNDYPSAGPNPRVKPGMVLALEPMVNCGKPEIKTGRGKDNWTVYTADGSLSAHFEHTIAILDGSTEILTQLK